MPGSSKGGEYDIWDILLREFIINNTHLDLRKKVRYSNINLLY